MRAREGTLGEEKPILRFVDIFFRNGSLYTYNVVVMYNVLRITVTHLWRSILRTQLKGVYFDDVTPYMCRLQVFPCRTPRGTHS